MKFAMEYKKLVYIIMISQKKEVQTDYYAGLPDETDLLNLDNSLSNCLNSNGFFTVKFEQMPVHLHSIFSLNSVELEDKSIKNQKNKLKIIELSSLPKDLVNIIFEYQQPCLVFWSHDQYHEFDHNSFDGEKYELMKVKCDTLFVESNQKNTLFVESNQKNTQIHLVLKSQTWYVHDVESGERESLNVEYSDFAFSKKWMNITNSTRVNDLILNFIIEFIKKNTRIIV
jgi:hypothetical protein